MTALPAPIDLSNDACTAAVHEHGAHLVAWAPAGSPPVLWLSPLAILDSASAIRGGVPICFPWFGPGRTGSLTPAHGFARLTAWRLASIEREAGTSEAHFMLDSSLATSPEFPFAYEAEYRIRVGDRLDVALTIVNRDSTAFVVEEALHAYLAVGDVERVHLDGLDGATFVDKVTGPADPPTVQRGAVRFSGETDRVYRSAADVHVVDPVLGRRLHVTKEGSASTIVWNPGDVKAGQASDMGPDSWLGFVCVEGGNVQGDAITIAPGQASTMTYGIEVLPM